MEAAFSRYLLQFQVNPSGAAFPKVNIYEKVAKVCLFPLHLAVGRTVVISYGRISAVHDKKIKRITDIVVLIFAFTTLLPFTLIGLGLLAISDTHKVKYWVSEAHHVPVANWSRALEKIHRALNIFPDSPFALGHQAYTYNQQHMREEASQSAEKALEGDPNNVYALATKGKVSLHRGEHDEALKCADQILSLIPNYVRAHFIRIRTYLAQKDYVQLFDSCQAALHANSRLHKISLFQAIALLGKDDPEDALEHIEQFINNGEAPQDIRAWTIQAMAYVKQGHLGQASRAIRRALDRAPDYTVGWMVKAHIYGMRTKYDKAIQALDRVLELVPNQEWATEFKSRIPQGMLRNIVNRAPVVSEIPLQLLITTSSGVRHP